MDGRRRHRPQGRFRRRPVALRAVVPASAALSSRLQQLPSLVRVPELGRRGARRGDRGGAQLRRDADGRPGLRHLRGVPDRREDVAASTARPPSCVFARDALRIAIATERSGLEFYTARRRHDEAIRAGAASFSSSPRKSGSISARSRSATRAARRRIRSSRSRPTFLFFKGAASGLFAEGAEKLRQGRRRPAGAAHRHQVRARLAQVLQALRRAVRGLRRQADLPRVRRRGARPSRPAHPRVPRAARAPRRAGAPAQRAPRPRGPRVDRSSHPHDRVRRPVHAGASSSPAPPRPASRCSSVTDHDTVAGCAAAAAACAAAGIAFVPGIEITAVVDGADVHVLGYFIDAGVAGAPSVSGRAAPAPRSTACAQMIASAGRARHRARRRRDSRSPASTTRPSRPAGRGSRARWSRGGHVADINEAFDRWLARGRPAFVPRMGAAPAGGVRAHSRRRRHRVARAPGARSSTTSGFPASPTPASTRSRRTTPTTIAPRPAHYLRLADRSAWPCHGGSDYHGDARRTAAARPGEVSLPRERTSTAAGGRASGAPTQRGATRLGLRLDLLVEQHLEAARTARAARPASAGDRASRSAAVRALRFGERLVQHEHRPASAPRVSDGNRSRCR